MLDLFRAHRLLARGQRLLDLGRVPEAKAALERARELAPRDHGPPLHLALAHAAAGEPGRGVDELERARETFPEPAVYALFHGRLLLEAGNPVAAVAALEAACAAAPENRLAGAYLRLARFEAHRDADAARALLREGLGTSSAYQRRLVLALEHGLFLDPPTEEPPFIDVKVAATTSSAAPPPFDQAPSWSPWGWIAGRWHKARALWRDNAKDLEGELVALRAAAARRPRDVEVSALYASVLLELGREQEALDVLLWRKAEMARAQERDELEVPTLALIGLCYYQLLARAHAAAWIDYAAEREREQLPWPVCQYARALLLEARGERSAAATLLDEVETGEPAFLHDRIICLLRRMAGPETAA